MSDISSRLKGSLRLDAFNGDSHERAICVMQVRQAVKELDRLAARVRELEVKKKVLGEVVKAAGWVRERLTGHPNTDNCPCGACRAGRAYDAARAKAEGKGKP